MNFVLISPIGADVNLMPKTRPGWTTGTSVSTPTPWRHVHRLLPHRARNPFRTDHENTRISRIKRRTLLAWRTRALFSSLAWKSLSLAYCFPGPLSLSLSAINVHFYCHLRNSAHYHNNNTERGGMRSPETTDHESPTIRDGK